MEWGRRDPLDPGPLVAALQLDHAVQQDGQEFMKLFLGLLEARFQAQNPLDALLRVRGRKGGGGEVRRGLLRHQMSASMAVLGCPDGSHSPLTVVPADTHSAPVPGRERVRDAMLPLRPCLGLLWAARGVL